MKTPDRGPLGETESTGLRLGRFAPGATSSSVPEGLVASETELVCKAALETVAAGAGKPVVVPRTAAPLTPDELLGAVAYCYVKGVFSSADIEQTMLSDPEFRAALNGVVPDPGTLRRFRRLNREAIQTVLEKFYALLRRQQRLVRETFASTNPIQAAPVNPVSIVQPRRGENTATFVKREATECLDRATFIDGMSDY